MCESCERECITGETLAACLYFDEAIAAFSDAIQHSNKTLAAAYAGRGKVYETIGETDKAIEDLSAAIALDPTNARYYEERSRVYAHKGCMDKVVEDSSLAIRIDSSNTGFLLQRSVAYWSLSLYDLALDDYVKAVALLGERFPGIEAHHLNRDTIKNGEDVYNAITGIIAGFGIEEQVPILSMLAWSYHQRKDYHLALKVCATLEQALADTDFDGKKRVDFQNREFEGKIFSATSDHEKAADAYESILRELDSRDCQLPFSVLRKYHEAMRALGKEPQYH